MKMNLQSTLTNAISGGDKVVLMAGLGGNMAKKEIENILWPHVVLHRNSNDESRQWPRCKTV